MKLRGVVVDDERLARVSLKRLLTDHGGVEVVGEADSVEAAAALLAQVNADVVFLDIQMPGGSGFDLLERFEVQARVIFVTAYDTYALRAFEVNALDYLLKPVRPERLAEALARVQETTLPEAGGIRLTLADVVCLPMALGMKLCRVQQIVWIGAADDYSEVHLQGGGVVLTSTPLRVWEKRLPEGFIRIHRSTIVNVDHVDTITRGEGDSYLVRVVGGAPELIMSRRYAAQIQERLGRHLS